MFRVSLQSLCDRNNSTYAQQACSLLKIVQKGNPCAEGLSAAPQFGAANELEERGDPVSAILARLQQLQRGSDNPPANAYEPLLDQATEIPSAFAQAVILHASEETSTAFANVIVID